MGNQKVTRRKTAVLSIFTLFLSILAGIVLMGQRVVLLPPMASFTTFFYLATVLLPTLIVFLVNSRRHPTGSKVAVAGLSIIASGMICLYFTLIGPALYVDIQCQTVDRRGLIARLDCQCEYNVSGGTAQAPCVAEQLWPFPLMRLIEETR